jgi:predicted RND superfamily exporter protein
MGHTPPPVQPDLGSRHRLLLRIERFSRQRYKLVFLIALLAVVAAGWLGSKIKIESDLLKLIPAGNVQVDTLKEALQDFGSIDYLLVLMEATGEAGPDELETFADSFAQQLENNDDLIEFVDHRFALDEGFLDLFYDNAILFLEPERLDELAKRLTDEAIVEQVEENRLALTTPMAQITQDVVRNDPLGLLDLFLKPLVSNRSALQVDLANGYYLSADHHNLIMLVKPTQPSQNLDFDAKLMEFVSAVETIVRSELDADLELGSAIDIRYGGHYAMAIDESNHIRKDVKQNLFVSLLAVAALYWICYRRFAALLYSSIPLLVGQALTFGLAFFALGQLNAASSAFTALLMGLGTDFVIVMYARYVEERQNGRTLVEATQLMIGETGLGVFTGAITSAGTFFAMCISQFIGLRHLGFLIGSGILLCGVAIVFMLPAMIKWNEGVRHRKVDAVAKLHLQSFGLEHLITFAARHRALTLTLVFGLTLAAGAAALRLDFDDSVRALRSQRSEGFRVQQEITEKFGRSLSYMMAIVEAPTETEAVDLAVKVQQRLQPFLDDGTVSSHDTILAYLPPEARQQEVLEWLARDTSGTFDAARVQSTFHDALVASDFRVEAYDDFVGRLTGFLGPEKPLKITDLQQHGLDQLLSRYVLSEPGRVRIVTYMFLADKRWKREPPPNLVEAVTGGDAGIVVTGTNVVNREFRHIFMREAPRAVMLGLIVVFVLLWIDFRSLRLTAIAMAQLVCGVVLMLGAMKVAGIRLNYVNAFVATMILGVGIDYSIHLVHRFTLSQGRVEVGLLETGKAVVIAALTNIAGFGTLTLASYPAMRSFGIVALFGSITCLFTALTVVPAIMGREETGP